MKIDKLITSLQLLCYNFDKKNNLIKKLKTETCYELTSENIKILRFLNTKNIEYQEDIEGNIKVFNKQ